MTNETVEQVCGKEIYTWEIYNAGHKSFDEVCLLDDHNEVVENALAAHKRELAAKDAERLTVSTNYESVIASKDRIIASKDAEIARLKSCIAGDCERMRLGAEPCANCHIKRVNERNEIINELADALWDENGYSYQELLAKAREVVVSKNATTTEDAK